MFGRGTPMRTYLWLLAGLLVIAGIAYAIELVATPAAVAPTIPPPAPTAQDVIGSQQPFQYLVSYDGSQFLPAMLSMKVGQTARFTNNGTSPLQISEQWMQSPELQQGDYWQFTASAPGSYTFVGGGTTMTITVTNQ